MLCRLHAAVREISCNDKVNETTDIFKWTKKATEEMKKLNRYYNLTAGLEAVLPVAVGARVMLHRNVDTYDGTVRSGVQSRYGICCIILCKTA